MGPICTCPPGLRRMAFDRHPPPCPLWKPGVVDTPEKAARYARSLLDDLKRMEKIVGELPDYFEHLPIEARAELVLRLRNLHYRLGKFLAAL